MRQPDANEHIEASRSVDEDRWTGYQVLLVLGTALTIILDGVDNQLLPNAIPTLIREWGRPRADFTNALAIGPFGMMLGGLIGGLIGDRLGRRPALLGSVVTFGALTAAIASVNSIETLSALRFLAGLGLGGAMPNAATLAAEYVPRRHRPVAVTLTIVSIPLGGALAGEVAAMVIPTQGWRMLFVVCGVVSVAVAIVLWKILPESPRFLTPAIGAAPVSTSGGKIAALFRDGLARDTTALWASFFFSLMVNYVVILLLPALLTSAAVGFNQPTASRALAMSNYGGVAGAVLGALAVQRVGSRIAMLGMSIGAVLCGVVLASWPLDPQQPAGLLAMILVAGGFMNGVQTTMYALAAHVYPTAIRSTGVGTAVAVGRIGNVLAAYAGSLAIDRGGSAGYFGLWSVLMAAVFAALACIRRHVPGASARPQELLSR